MSSHNLHLCELKKAHSAFSHEQERKAKFAELADKLDGTDDEKFDSVIAVIQLMYNCHITADAQYMLNGVLTKIQNYYRNFPEIAGRLDKITKEADALDAENMAYMAIKPDQKTPYIGAKQIRRKNARELFATHIRRIWDSINLGVPSGKDNGIVVIDFDTSNAMPVTGKKSGTEFYEQFVKPIMDKEKIETRTVKTPNGLHLYFKYIQHDCLKTRVGTIHDGQYYTVDIRSNESYVVCPPSMVNGLEYKYEGTRKIAPMPSSLLDILTSPANKFDQRIRANYNG